MRFAHVVGLQVAVLHLEGVHVRDARGDLLHPLGHLGWWWRRCHDLRAEGAADEELHDDAEHVAVVKVARCDVCDDVGMIELLQQPRFFHEPIGVDLRERTRISQASAKHQPSMLLGPRAFEH